MKHSVVFLLLLVAVSLVTTFPAEAQDRKTADSLRICYLIKKSSDEKTLLSWDQLAQLYQVALQDLTANDKSAEFKSTIYGLHKIFKPSITDSKCYRELEWERRIEPDIIYKYLGNFNPNNVSVGFNISIINRNDVTTSPLINNNNVLFKLQKEFDNTAWFKLDSILLHEANARREHLEATKRDLLVREKLLTQFITTGDSTVFKNDPDLGKLVKSVTGTLNGESMTFFDGALQLNAAVNTLYNKIKRRLSLTLTPTWTYGLNFGSVQGYEFALKAIKGLKFFPNEKRLTQLILKGSYKIGDDTIVNVPNLHRTQITNQLGFNQVVLTKKIDLDDGSEPAEKPVIELGITGGCNWILSGLQGDEKSLQPTMQARLGFLLGKDSWLAFPFSYNFETHKGLASISIKVNLGDPPFK